MKKKFTFLMALFALMLITLPGMMKGQTRAAATWTASEQGYDHNDEVTDITIVSNVLNGSFAKLPAGSTNPVYNSTDEGVRMYVNNTLTITPVNDETITAVTLTVKCNKSSGKNPAYPTGISVNTGNITAGSTPGQDVTSVVWSGSTTSDLVFTVNGSKGNVAVKVISITYTPIAPAYTITAVSNNESYGTVSLTGTTITATPNANYRVSTTTPYEVTSGTATVTNNGNNTFTVTTSEDCTVQINFEALPPAYTVTLGDDNSTLTETTGGAGVTLPSRSNIGDYTFAGWSATNVASETTTAPTIIPAGSYAPTANITLYPVYERTEGASVDVLNRELTGVTSGSTTYSAWSGKTSISSAVYAGNSAGGNNAIQLRSNNSNSGIVTTNSGGTVKKVSITWDSSTQEGRQVDVYGKNTAYSAATNLYGDDAGTKLGSIVYGTSTELSISGSYEYIGLRSNNGALYLTEVDITWSTSSSTTYYNSGYSLPISAWTTEPVGGWYLIAAPVGTTAAAGIGNLTSNSYNLYRFNQAAESEWENYKQTGDHYHFDLEPGQGYLYANSTDVKLTFFDQLTENSYDVSLVFSDDNSNSKMHGWNLIGNPFATTATIKDSENQAKPFYRMNDGHTGLIADAITGDVNALEGIFVHTYSGEDVTFTKTVSKRAIESNDNNIVINLNDGKGTVIDRAIVRFDEGEALPKFQLRDNSTKLYIPQNGKDYAIAAMDDNTQAFNLNFHAKTTGKYTLCLGETSNLSYIHIFDRMTGEDVDMLLEDSYSFIGSPADSEERFIVRLGYNASSTGSEIFACQSGNGIIVNGEGTLEVYDVTGRKVMTTTINGIQTVTNLNNGFYIFRLNEKTQKIVVR